MKKHEALELSRYCIKAWERGCDPSDYWPDIIQALTAIEENLAQQASTQCEEHVHQGS